MKSAEELLTLHRGLAVACAKRFQGRGVPMEELIGEGEAALWQACLRFEEERGLRFSTYAVPVVLGALRQLCHQAAPMHVPRGDRQVLAAAYQARERLYQAQGREPGLWQVARAIGAEPARLSQMLSARERVQSAPVENGPVQPGFEDHVLLMDALRRLPPPLPQVCRLRFQKGLTQQQTARILGVSQSFVSRCEGRIRKAVGEAEQGEGDA